MRRLIIFVAFVLVGITGFPACTVNVNQNANQAANANRVNAVSQTTSSPIASAPVAKARWSVVVCSSRASAVTMSAGPSENDSQLFATYKDGAAQKAFDFPARVQNLSSVYFKTSGAETNPVELCVLFDGKPKKRVAFDEGSESHIINSSDDDDNDCRCTQ